MKKIVLTVAFCLLVYNQASAQSQPKLWTAEDYYKRGNTNARNGKYDLAIADYTEALRLSPNNSKVKFGAANLDASKAYLARGFAYNKKGNHDLAVKDYTEVIRLDPNDAGAYNARAWTYAYHLKTNFDRAIADATQAIKLSPANANCYDTRGWAYLGKGDNNKANDDFLKALQLDPNMESSKEGLKKTREAQAEEVIDWSEFE